MDRLRTGNLQSLMDTFDAAGRQRRPVGTGMFDYLTFCFLCDARVSTFLTQGIIALAAMSTAFTSQIVATGFERRYGLLKRYGATLSPPRLMAAKAVTEIAVELLQGALILIVAVAIATSLGISLGVMNFSIDRFVHVGRPIGILSSDIL
jgi:hypothetical protein